MLWKKISGVTAKTSYFHLPAFSLIENLLALALGAMILFSISSLYSYFILSQDKQMELLNLQKEAHQLANYLQQHIQHLGYQGNHRKDHNFDLFEKDGLRYGLPTPNCFIFFYDLNNDGCLGKRRTKNAECKIGDLNNTKELAKEIFGFKAENKEIYLYSENKLENCSDIQCKQLLSSCSDKWTKFTSIEQFSVEKFEFHWKKKDELLQVDLSLSSVKQKNIHYSTTIYISLLNKKYAE